MSRFQCSSRKTNFSFRTPSPPRTPADSEDALPFQPSPIRVVTATARQTGCKRVKESFQLHIPSPRKKRRTGEIEVPEETIESVPEDTPMDDGDQGWVDEDPPPLSKYQRYKRSAAGVSQSFHPRYSSVCLYIESLL